MHVDLAISRQAARQDGLVTTEQMQRLGLSSAAIAWRVRTGRLHRMFRGVYLVGHSVALPFARERGAILAVGEPAFVSHRSALVLWGLLEPVTDAAIDVSVVGRTRANRPGIRVHGTSHLPQHDRSRRHGVPVTSAARALVDFAAFGTASELEHAFDEALIQRRTSRSRLHALAAERAGRHGAAGVRALLNRSEPPAFNRSAGERKLHALICAGGLPRPERNVRVCGHELDFYWPELNVELDGWDVHRDRREADYIRDDELQANGIRVLRITGRQLAYEPEQTLVRIAQALARVSPGSAPRSAAAP